MFFFQGLTMGLAYVAPIGMQNLFVIHSALSHSLRRAVVTALIVLFFDISLSLSCFTASAACWIIFPGSKRSFWAQVRCSSSTWPMA